MLAVNYKEEEKYGCPNCGCDRWGIDNFYKGNQPSGTCKSCGLHYQIFADGIYKSDMGFSTGRKDEDGNDLVTIDKRLEQFE